jgi:hypothetical protein
MPNLVDLLLPPFWVGVACAVVYTAIDSPVRPVQSIVKSWNNAFAYVLEHYAVALVALSIFLVMPLLNFFVSGYLAQFSAFDRELLLGPSDWQLMVLGVGWQALAAGLLGFVALRLHFDASAIDDLYAEPPPDVFNRRCAVWAFGAGVGVYLALIVADYGFNQFVELLPMDWQPLGGTVTFWVRALLSAMLALVRPTLSLGAREPFRGAFEAFAKRPIVFLIWISALSVPLGVAEFAKDCFIEPGDLEATSFWAGNGCLAVFSVLNYIAYEMTTFRMLRNLFLETEVEYGFGAEGEPQQIAGVEMSS